MTRYILKRVFYAVLTLLILITLTFFMMRLLPGDPFLGEKALPPAVEEAINQKYGLDKPLMEQYFIFMGNVLKGDLGVSLVYNRPVSQIISESFPYSFDL
ncbi:MAG: ABC transporter permease, partial [Oscillospiraceae bacterium]